MIVLRIEVVAYSNSNNNMKAIGVRDGGAGEDVPPKFGKKIFFRAIIM